MDYLDLMMETAPPAAVAEIAGIEQKVGASLPDDLRAFLEQSNGGVFSAEFVELAKGEYTVLNAIYALGDSDYGSMAEEYASLTEDQRIPRLALPIGEDPGGNLFLLCLEKAGYGQVYFWDHEVEAPSGGTAFADFPNVRRIAGSFDAFVRGLKETDDDS